MQISKNMRINKFNSIKKSLPFMRNNQMRYLILILQNVKRNSTLIINCNENFIANREKKNCAPTAA